mgnify:CR=1 FL=1
MTQNNLPVIQDMQQMSAEDQTHAVNVTPYEVDMEASVYEFGNHVSECNIEFRENIFKKVQSIK